MMTDDAASSVPAGAAAGDPLAAFVAAMHDAEGVAAGSDTSPAGVPIPANMLSNGLNADAGVAQLVSALASLPDANSAFDATPSAAVGDQDASAVVAPET